MEGIQAPLRNSIKSIFQSDMAVPQFENSRLGRSNLDVDICRVKY